MPLEGVRPPDVANHRARIPVSRLVHDPGEISPAVGGHRLKAEGQASEGQRLQDDADGRRILAGCEAVRRNVATLEEADPRPPRAESYFATTTLHQLAADYDAMLKGLERNGSEWG